MCRRPPGLEELELSIEFEYEPLDSVYPEPPCPEPRPVCDGVLTVVEQPQVGPSVLR